MIICQVNAMFSGMEKSDIELELKVIEDILEVVGGELIDADVSMAHGHLVAYARVESKMVAKDIFEASRFVVENISPLGRLHQDYSDFQKPGRTAKPKAAAAKTDDYTGLSLFTFQVWPQQRLQAIHF